MAPFDTKPEHWLSDAEGRLRKRRFAAVLAGIYALFVATYLPINAFSLGRAAHTLFLPGEERLPFLPIFEYLYVLTYFMPALLIVTVRDYASFQRLVRAYGLTLLTAYTTYLLFPVYFERPHLEVSSVHTWLLSLEYLDKPYNHFPSLHVALSWLAVHASAVSRRSRVGLGVLAVGISVSTVFVKQHYIVDVLFGFALAWVAWRARAFPPAMNCRLRLPHRLVEREARRLGIPTHVRPEPFRGRGGPRKGIGSNIAILQMLLILAVFVRRYDFELVNPGDVAIDPRMILHPKGAIEWTVHRA